RRRVVGEEADRRPKRLSLEEKTRRSATVQCTPVGDMSHLRTPFSTINAASWTCVHTVSDDAGKSRLNGARPRCVARPRLEIRLMPELSGFVFCRSGVLTKLFGAEQCRAAEQRRARHPGGLPLL